MKPKINLSLAAFAGLDCLTAMHAYQGFQDQHLGEYAVDHIQLCPQNRGVIDHGVCDSLISVFPASKFRLHANARVLAKHQLLDLIDFDQEHPYWFALAAINQRLGNYGYSLHAGRRGALSLQQLFWRLHALEDLFKCPVAIEGMYPSRHENYYLSSWHEYAQLLNADIHYAIDVSHLNIVATFERRYERDLVRALLSSPKCIEVHVSGNNGLSDQHQVLSESPVWLSDLEYCHPEAIVFSESFLGKNHAHTL